jgi:LysM repeat protein
LGGGAPQKRRVFFRNKDATQALDVVVYPALSEDQFDGILSYAKTEKWPLTSKGLFFEVKRSGREVDLSLLEAFYATPEFFSVHTFFQKVGLLVDKNVIVSLLTEGDWEMIDKFCEQQRLLQDFSEEKRVTFLMNYFDHYHSTLSAFLLTLHDQEFVMRRLDDNTLLQFMNLIVDKKDPLQNMAKSILVSPRSDLVRRAAASLLYASQNETLPEPYDYLATVERFCPESIKRSSLEGQKPLTQAKPALQAVASQVSIDKKMKQSSYRMHTIESGDSLWKISRKYKVSIEELKKLNHLESEKLKVGRQLQIPNT